MVVQHNLTAMNSNRQLGITTGIQAKSSEKLSSGYKINRAADDAACLAISEKMRRQIRGLDQAIENVQDGISLMQIADGALNETHAILQRANELAVRAANDTLTEDDRSYIQSEIDAITAEVDHIAKTTNFNDKVFPLTGKVIEELDDSFNFGIITEFTENTLNRSTTDQIFDGKPWNVGERAAMHGIQFPDGYHSGGTSHFVHYLDGVGSYGPEIPSYEDVTNVGTYYNNSYSLRKSDFNVDDDGYLYYTSTLNNQKYYIYKDDNTGNHRGYQGPFSIRVKRPC